LTAIVLKEMDGSIISKTVIFELDGIKYHLMHITTDENELGTIQVSGEYVENPYKSRDILKNYLFRIRTEHRNNLIHSSVLFNGKGYTSEYNKINGSIFHNKFSEQKEEYFIDEDGREIKRPPDYW
jgi:hypothetical protein